MNLDTGDRVIISGHPEEVFEVLERYYREPDVQEGLLYVSLKQQDGHEIVQFPVKLLEKAPHGVKPGQVYHNGLGTRIFVTHVTDEHVFYCAVYLATHQAATIDNFVADYELELDV